MRFRLIISVLTFVLRFLIRMPLNFLYLISKIWPKRKDIWIFGGFSGKDFWGNSKYLYLYTSHNYPKIEAIWISRNKELVKELKSKGYKSVRKWSLQGIKYALRAKFVIYDNIPNSVNKYFANGINIQLYHGIPLKKIDIKSLSKNPVIYKFWNTLRYSRGFKRLFFKLFFPYVIKTDDWAFISTPNYIEEFSEALCINKEKIIPLGFPRNDVLFSLIKGMEIGMDLTSFKIVKKASEEGKKILIYMPTFRDTGDTAFDQIFNLEALNGVLENLNAILIIKYHAASSLIHYIKSYTAQKKNDKLNFVIYDTASDIQPILPYSNLLISDYSGVFFDYLFLDKPIIFYAHDLEKYLQEDRELYHDYHSYVPGIIVYNFNDMLNMIQSIIQKNRDTFKKKRLELKSKLYEYVDNESSERIVSFLLNHYNLKDLKN